MHGVSTKRGGPATDALGILPGLGGTSVQDGWAPSRPYGCRHALCNAPQRRALTWVEEQEGQAWAGAMKALLGTIKAVVDAARTVGRTSLEAAARAAFVRRDAELVQEGLAAPRRSAPPGRADAASSARQCHHHFDLAGAAGQQ